MRRPRLPGRRRPGDTPARVAGRLAARLVARTFPRRFGLLEVLAIGSLEWMRRHLAILNALEDVRRRAGRSPIRVLDFGGADGSLARALRFYGLADQYVLTLVDTDREAIERAVVLAPTEAAVAIEPEGSLPFADGAFDVVVSSDVFEHIPAGGRRHWARETARVARLAQIHTMPLDGGAGRWDSTRYDRAYDAWLRRTTGRPDRWTTEHLVHGVPTAETVAKILRPTTLSGIANGEVWLASMQAQQGPKDLVSRLRFAVRYLRRLRGIEARPPFKNALVVVEMGTGAGEDRQRREVDDAEADRSRDHAEVGEGR